MTCRTQYPPVLIPVAVESRIPEPDAALADDHRWTSVWCGKSAEDPYTHGRWDFRQPASATCHTFK